MFENLGEERRISVRIGEELLTLITTAEKRYKKDEKFLLEVQAEKTHLFDIQTGERIRSKE